MSDSTELSTDDAHGEGSNGADILEGRRGSARHLLELYSIATGLALAAGLERLTRSDETGSSIHWTALPLFLAFLVTLIPYFHGALRHLDRTWIENADTATPDRMMIDFIALFAQVCLLFLLGKFELSPRPFLVTLILLLLLDSIWAAISTGLEWFHFPSLRTGKGAIAHVFHWEGGLRSWFWTNLVIAAVGLAMLYIFDRTDADPLTISWIICLLCVVRTVIDYTASWNFYFPSIGVK